MLARPALRGAALLAAAALVVTGCGSDDDDRRLRERRRQRLLRRLPGHREHRLRRRRRSRRSPPASSPSAGRDAETALALGVQPVGASDWLGVRRRGRRPVGRGAATTRRRRSSRRSSPARGDRGPGARPDPRHPVRRHAGALRPAQRDRADRSGSPRASSAYQTTWQQQLELVGQALGKPDEAAELAAEVEQAFADAAAEHPEFEGTEVAVAAYTSEGFGAYVQRRRPRRLHGGAGLREQAGHPGAGRRTASSCR